MRLLWKRPTLDAWHVERRADQKRARERTCSGAIIGSIRSEAWRRMLRVQPAYAIIIPRPDWLPTSDTLVAADFGFWGEESWRNPQPGSGSTYDADMCRRHDGLLPFLQAAGPVPEDECVGEDFLNYDLDLYTAIGETMLTLEHVSCAQRIKEEMVRLLTTTVVSWTTCSATIMQFLLDIQDHTAVFEHDINPFVAVLGELQRPDSWPFLQEFPPKETHRDGQEWEAIFSAAADVWESPSCPRPFGSHRYVLHLFAGRSRPGDVEFYMRQSPISDGVTVHVVSLDVIIDSKWGNLLDLDVRQFWLQGIRDGFVVGMLSGPPCETWSRARGRSIEGRSKGPRIIRDAAHLWGFSCVGLKECKQLIFGNSLLLFTLEAVVELLLSGGSALVEHPSCPDEVELASIWRLPVVRFLLAQTDVNLVHLAQGLFGAPSPKPTTLLALRMPELSGHLDACQLRYVMPKNVSIGLDESGAFRTAVLKEYPPALCCALGTALREAACRYHLDPSAGEPSDHFCTVAARMESRDYGDAMGRDFMGG